jgi:pyruvate kinase
MRKTKIICTLGPAVDSEQAIRELILGGMNAARFNFSHGTHESHLALLNKLRHVRDDLGRPVAAILDTKGPEIRIKTFQDGPITLAPGDHFTLTVDDVPGTQERVSVTYANLHHELPRGARVLIDDGLVELTVDAVEGSEIHCTVVSGGELSNNKSINIPDVPILLPSMTERDKDDIRFAVEQDFDYIAASFVRKAQDVKDIRALLKECGGEDIRIIAKIENREGVNNLEEIIDAADGIMVARGDLGVEIPAHEVPVLQKEMISKSVRQGKTVIIATQMLDSMIRNPRATRAEISDVANAVFDGASCVMLSGETASGKYPMEALSTMVDTITAAEDSINYWGRFQKLSTPPLNTVSDAITHTCCLAAMDLDAKAILAASSSGSTPRMIARFKPACTIAALTLTERVRRQLSIVWGVHPYLYGTVDSTDRLFSLAVDCARKEGVVQPGDTVVITAGLPIGKSGSTNLIKAQVIDEPVQGR